MRPYITQKRAKESEKKEEEESRIFEVKNLLYLKEQDAHVRKNIRKKKDIKAAHT